MQNHFAQETIIYFEWKLEQLKSNGPRTVRFSQNDEKIPVLKSDIEWKLRRGPVYLKIIAIRK